MVTATWDTIGDSPAVDAFEYALERAWAGVPMPQPFDVRSFEAWDTIPLDRLEAQTKLMTMPDKGALGEAFLRKVWRHKYQYHWNRNRLSGLDLLAEDAGFTYVIQAWGYSGQRKNAVTVCIGPPPGQTFTFPYQAAIIRWVEWMIPHFDGRVSVLACPQTDLTLHLQIAGMVRAQQIAYATHVSGAPAPLWFGSVGSPSGANNPRGLAVGPAGELAVVAADTDLLYISANRGATWSTGKSLPTGVNAPRGVAVADDGDIFIVDATTRGIYVSADDGDTWGAKKSLPSGVLNPSGLSINLQGQLFLLDYQTDGFYVSADDGDTWGAKKSLPSGSTGATGIAVAPNGDIWIADDDTNSLSVSADDGDTWNDGPDLPSGVTLPRGLTFDHDGILLLLDAFTDKIYFYG